MKSVQPKNLIAVDEFCFNNNVETSFISLLEQNGLIEISIIEETKFIEADQLRELERMVRFYYELNINLEGIETITHLLQRIDTLQQELITLKNKISFYE
ncbi:MAG: chaperone modulator CbpM [Paludibacteraceae bacterium]|nr:chaperone modulator CbpM [Paludibacteraceae bacterium]